VRQRCSGALERSGESIGMSLWAYQIATRISFGSKNFALPIRPSEKPQASTVFQTSCQALSSTAANDARARLMPFVAYGPSHWAALTIFLMLVPAVVFLGHRMSGSPWEQAVGRGFSLIILAVAVPFQLYAILPAHWDVRYSLPLHICDLAWMLAAYALWTSNRRAAALLYYWGLTLTTQALLTPHLDFDFPHLQYLMFWCGHEAVPLAAVYLVWGRGLRPDWQDYRIALGTTIGWGLLVIVFNVASGANYMYLNAKPPTASLLDFFGPWPAYLAVEGAVIVVVWAAMTWPWARCR